MSTLLAHTQEKLQNVESSMGFMQAEHAHTLHGLHEEIHKLQTKCSELTFELHMNSAVPSTTQCDHRGEINLLKQKYKAKLTEIREDNVKLKTGLDTKIAKVKLLEFQAKTHKEDSIESLQKKDILIKSLRAELDTKSDDLAYLMSKLHNAKLIQMKVPEKDRLTSSERSKRGFSPTPPPLRKNSPRPHSRCRSIDFSQNMLSDPMTAAAAEILSEQDSAVIVTNNVPLPAIGDKSASRSFLSKMKFNRTREPKPLMMNHQQSRAAQ